MSLTKRRVLESLPKIALVKLTQKVELPIHMSRSKAEFVDEFMGARRIGFPEILEKASRDGLNEVSPAGLDEQLKESSRLKKEIRKNLSNLGFPLGG